MSGQPPSDHPPLRTIIKGESQKGSLPILLVHGFGGTMQSWHALQERLAERTKAIAIELPGHGAATDYPGFGPPKVAARAILANMTRLGHERFHVVGHSMGGAVSSLITLFAPDRVASATLLAPGGFGPEINLDILGRFVAATSTDDIAELLPRFYTPGYELDPDVIENQWRCLSAPGVLEALQHIKGIVFKDGVQGTLPLADIGALNVPVDVIWGGLDEIIPSHQMENLPVGFTTHLFPNVGHMPAEEITDDVFSIIAGRL
ncbi:MAG: alpha/beta fold hydrolase [Pseudomonadota bacterium]